MQPPAHLADRIRAGRSTLEGERKQITVMFADIKGSTGIIEGLDPEQAEQRLSPALRVMIDAVHRYEGTINRVQGDGIMALFGAPLAHEDHAVRAAYAALDLQAGVRSLCAPEIAVRVGLHSGEVVVRAIHNDLSLDYDAIGPTVHLASRLEQMAEPGTICCTGTVTRLAEGFIEATSLGEVRVRGLTIPVPVFQVHRATPARTRWDVAAGRGLSPLIGRERELATLHQALERATGGRGHVAIVCGEPGVGKSRLVHELTHSEAAASWALLTAACSLPSKSTPYGLVANILRSWCGAPLDAAPSQVRQLVREKLGPDVDWPALDTILDLQPNDPEWSANEPPSRRRRIFATVKDFVVRLARRHGLLVWLEDVQWIDTESQAILESIVGHLGAEAVLVVATHRAGFQHKWHEQDYFSEITVGRLEHAKADEMVQQWLGPASINEPVRRRIVERTDGTPFFIEETIRSLVETGALGGAPGHYELRHAIEDITIPETVQSVLAARIDRLSSSQKALLQTASVLGFEVPMRFLRAITDFTDGQLFDRLTGLQDAQLLLAADGSAETLRFRHSLTQEVAYDSLLVAKRRELHGRVVRAIETLHEDSLNEVVEILAHHAFTAGLWDEAVTYLTRAGLKAVEVSAFREANSFLTRALTSLDKLPREQKHLVRGIDIRLHLRVALGATADYERLETCLHEAEALANEIDDRLRLGAVQVAKTFASNLRGDLDASIESGTLARAIAREVGDERLAVVSSIYLAQALLWRGDFRPLLELLDANSSWLAGHLRHERITTAATSSVLWLGMVAAARAYLGDFDDGIWAAREACATANELHRPYDVGLAHFYSGFVLSHRGDFFAALEPLEHALTVCRRSELSFLIPIVSTTLGDTLAHLSRGSEAVELLTTAMQQAKTARFYYAEAWATVYLAAAKLGHGSSEEAFRLAGSAAEFASRHGYKAPRAAASRISAEALRLLGELGAAERSYLECCSMASDLGLSPDLAHAQMGLARTYAQSGRPGKAAHMATSALELYGTMGFLISATDCDELHCIVRAQATV